MDALDICCKMRSLDVRPRQLSRVTGMNYETIRNIEKNCHENRHPYPGAPMTFTNTINSKGKGTHYSPFFRIFAAIFWIVYE